MSHRLKYSLCPYCGHAMDAATDVEADARPSPGDIGVCIECGGVLAYTDDLTLRAASQEEIETLDPKTRELLARMQAAQRMRRPRARKETPN
jgi:transcription initiation factor IIE alpha subunit